MHCLLARQGLDFEGVHNMKAGQSKMLIYSGAVVYWSIPALAIMAPDMFGSLLLGMFPLLVTQTGGSILCLLGFNALLRLQFASAKNDPLSNGLRGKFVTAGLISIIAGISLAFPILQISLPVPIATITTYSGITFMFLSLAIWIFILVFFPKVRLKNNKTSRS